MSDIVVLGAGEIGGAVARLVAAADMATRVVMVDVAEAVATGKALDIQQSAAIDGFATRVVGTGEMSAIVGATAIVVADQYGSPAQEWQGDAGVSLIRRVIGFNERALIVCAGATQVGLVERSVAELGVSPARIFGSAGEALRSAAIALAALEAACVPADISLALLGRPPRQVVIPWDAASVAGQAASNVLPPPALARLETRISRVWPPGPLTLASAAARMVHAALTRSPRTMTALMVHRGDDAEDRLCAMQSVKVGRAGIVRVVQPTLTPRDRVRLDSVASA
ncbi:MAG: hypothetical protein LC791_04625 [Acidobacteria bacterium]|nr:hypothetical protein [Acidobacteriota bacterium]